MSYHDGYGSPKNIGISVVNPLHRIESKLSKIKKLIDDIPMIEKMDIPELREAIKAIIND